MYVAHKFTDLVMTEALLEYFRQVSLSRKSQQDIKHTTQNLLKHCQYSAEPGTVIEMSILRLNIPELGKKN